MSDDQYDYYQYEQPQQQQMQQENIETTLEFQNCQAEELLRQNKFQAALKLFQVIYDKANEHNSRTWKAKSLHQLLEMHVRMGNGVEARNTLHSIREMNQVDKTNQQSVKSIIKTLNSVQRDVYQSFWQDIFALISGLEDLVAQIKCYFLMFEKEINLKNLNKSTQIYDKINSISSKVTQLPMSSELQFKYLEIMYLKLHKQEYISKLHSLYIKLPEYEQDTNSNQTYLSNIKQYIAPTLYQEQNYIECANFLCGSFIENAKYGSNSQKNKELLKINSLMVLLCGDLKYLEDSDFNPMLQESTAVYKIQPDIQALFGLAQAFRNQDINQFEQILKIVNLNLPKNSPYIDIQKRVLIAIKKQKIASICKCYKTIKYSYLKRRINESQDSTIQNLVFSLIASGKINGVIHLAEKYLELVPEENTYYTLQLENLRDLTERM